MGVGCKVGLRKTTDFSQLLRPAFCTPMSAWAFRPRHAGDSWLDRARHGTSNQHSRVVGQVWGSNLFFVVKLCPAPTARGEAAGGYITIHHYILYHYAASGGGAYTPTRGQASLGSLPCAGRCERCSFAPREVKRYSSPGPHGPLRPLTCVRERTLPWG